MKEKGCNVLSYTKYDMLGYVKCIQWISFLHEKDKPHKID